MPFSTYSRRSRSRRYSTSAFLAMSALDAIPRDYRSIFKLNINDGAFDYSIDENKEKELYQSFGKQAIFTDMNDWSSERIVKAYNSKHLVEDDFKVMKGALIIPVKPIYHWKDKRIKAHIFMCFLGVMFFRYMLHNVGELGMSAHQESDTTVSF